MPTPVAVHTSSPMITIDFSGARRASRLVEWHAFQASAAGCIHERTSATENNTGPRPLFRILQRASGQWQRSGSSPRGESSGSCYAPCGKAFSLWKVPCKCNTLPPIDYGMPAQTHHTTPPCSDAV